MKQGAHCLRLQSGRRGVFAKVVLTATPAEKPLDLTFAADEGQWWYRDARCWFQAVEFGIRYGYEQIQHELWKFHVGVRVSVDEVNGTVVDTNQIAMAYAAAMAFFDAVEISPAKLPTYDRETHLVTFP